MGVKDENSEGSRIEAAKAATDKSGMTQLMGMLAQMKLDPIDRVALEAMAAGMREFTFIMMRNTMRAQWKAALEANKPEQWRAPAMILGGFKLVTETMKVTNVIKMFEDAITECEAKAVKLEGGADSNVGDKKDDD